MKNRIFRSMFLLAVLAIVATVAGLSSYFSRELYDSMKQELRHEAICLAEAMSTADVEYLKRVSDSEIATRITLIGADGIVLFDNHIAEETQMDNHNERPEVAQARLYGSGEDVRDSATVGYQTMYYALLLEDGSVLRTAITVSTMWHDLLASVPFVLLLALAVLALALVVARHQVNRIVGPINEINLEKPLYGVAYEELRPLLQRIDKQNQMIRTQIAELEEKQREFATLTENMNEGLVIINDQGYILSINKRAMQIFGLQDKAIYENKHILMANRNLELQKLVDNGLRGQDQDLILELDGRVYQIMCNTIQKSGVAQGLVLFLLDVTEKQQQEQLRREFTANVSHELRTPLTAISGYAEIMMHGLVPAENVQPFAEKIYKEANRLITLIADIIQLSQLDESVGHFTWEAVDVAQLAEDVAQRLQPKAEQSGVTLNVYTEPAVITGISQVLQEILYNLCDNAIKYNKEDGTVKLSVVQSNGNAVINVVDTGIGIAPEDQPRIFERFYRADKSHSRLIGGTGLGLSIVKHGVQLHGGELQLESKPGQGTAITVRLPVEQPEHK